MRFFLLGALVLAFGASVALAAGGKVAFQDTVPSGKSSSVTVNPHHAAAFKVVLRVPTAGRAKLFLLGKKAPSPDC